MQVHVSLYGNAYVFTSKRMSKCTQGGFHEHKDTLQNFPDWVYSLCHLGSTWSCSKVCTVLTIQVKAHVPILVSPGLFYIFMLPCVYITLTGACCFYCCVFVSPVCLCPLLSSPARWRFLTEQAQPLLTRLNSDHCHQAQWQGDWKVYSVSWRHKMLEEYIHLWNFSWPLQVTNIEQRVFPLLIKVESHSECQIMSD